MSFDHDQTPAGDAVCLIWDSEPAIFLYDNPPGGEDRFQSQSLADGLQAIWLQHELN
jgi:hypothetical protein